MTIILTKEQIKHLETILSLSGTFSAPYGRIKTILKRGYYFDNLNSFNKPPSTLGTNDKTVLNNMNIKYLKYKNR